MKADTKILIVSTVMSLLVCGGVSVGLGVDHGWRTGAWGFIALGLLWDIRHELRSRR